VPCLYVQAAQDRLVPPDRLDDFRGRCRSLDVAVVQGGHFVLQENPAGGAEAVAAFLDRLPAHRVGGEA
jgi:pimeloyl-ACP methyl ester carboxylesterase